MDYCLQLSKPASLSSSKPQSAERQSEFECAKETHDRGRQRGGVGGMRNGRKSVG